MARKSDVLTSPFHLGLAGLFVLTSLAYPANGSAPEPAGASLTASHWLGRWPSSRS